jgi:PadR family transcriptional regulator PadR
MMNSSNESERAAGAETEAERAARAEAEAAAGAPAEGVSGAEGESDAEAAAAAEPDSGPRLHGDMLVSALLAFLKSSQAYGYQLTQELVDAGLANFDNGTVYRTLRQLEKSGYVASFWETGESGPARRMYRLTDAGDTFLSSWVGVMQNYQAVLLRAMGAFIPRSE